MAFIHEGRAEKRRFIRCGSRGMEPLRPPCCATATFRRLGFVFDDPEPARRQERPEPFGPKEASGWASRRFRPRGQTYPEELSREAVRLLAERYDRSSSTAAEGGDNASPRRWSARIPTSRRCSGKVGLDGRWT